MYILLTQILPEEIRQRPGQENSLRVQSQARLTCQNERGLEKSYMELSTSWYLVPTTIPLFQGVEKGSQTKHRRGKPLFVPTDVGGEVDGGTPKGQGPDPLGDPE